MLLAQETYTAPSSATTEYSTVIDFLHPDPSVTNKNVLLTVAASAVSGTNFDVALYGSDESGGTKYLLLDAVVADITTTAPGVKILDLNAYPAPYYYIAWTADADEDANTITVKWMIP